MPKTFAGFSTLLAKLRANAPADVPIINIGNKDGYEALHAFGMVQGAYVPGQSIRNWIFHVPGSTWAVAGQHQGDDASSSSGSRTTTSARTTTPWARTTPPRRTRKGTGVFYLGGNWQAQVIRAGLKANAGFMNMPPGPSGKYTAIGATSLPWHISSKTQVSRRRCGPDQLAHQRHRARRS